MNQAQAAASEKLRLATETELRQIGGWNTTARRLLRPELITAVVSARAAERPDAVAVVDGARRLTYGELAERAARLARRLRQLGCGPDIPVALAVERSPELIVGAFGILLAGAAYVPLDPAYPSERLGSMLRDARPAVVVTTAAILSSLRVDSAGAAAYSLVHMSDYHLNRALYDAARAHTLLDAMTDESVLAGYELTAEERDALRAGDIERLYELGANPYLIRRVFRARFHV